MQDYLAKVRELCFSFPEVSERISHGFPAFFVREKKTLAMYRPNEDPAALWCPAPPGAAADWAQAAPSAFYHPPYMGPRGWVGIHLSRVADWSMVDVIVRDAFHIIAPKRLIQALKARG